MKKKGSPRSRQNTTASVARMRLTFFKGALLKTDTVARIIKASIFRTP